MKYNKSIYKSNKNLQKKPDCSSDSVLIGTSMYGDVTVVESLKETLLVVVAVAVAAVVSVVEVVVVVIRVV